MLERVKVNKMNKKETSLAEVDDVIESDWARRIESDVPLDDYNEVLPGVFIGDKTLSEDKTGLKELGITHVVNAAMGEDLDQINTSQEFFKEVGIKFHGIKANDKPQCKLSPHFSPASDFIEEALQNKGKVFVHCMLGMSRSTSLVLAYLMIKRSMELIPAIKLLQDNRPMDINPGFLAELWDLEQKLISQR